MQLASIFDIKLDSLKQDAIKSIYIVYLPCNLAESMNFSFTFRVKSVYVASKILIFIFFFYLVCRNFRRGKYGRHGAMVLFHSEARE